MPDSQGGLWLPNGENLNVWTSGSQSASSAKYKSGPCMPCFTTQSNHTSSPKFGKANKNLFCNPKEQRAQYWGSSVDRRIDMAERNNIT